MGKESRWISVNNRDQLKVGEGGYTGDGYLYFCYGKTAGPGTQTVKVVTDHSFRSELLKALRQVTNADGVLTISGVNGGGVSAIVRELQGLGYLVASPTANLPNSRVLTGTEGQIVVDASVDGQLVLSLDPSALTSNEQIDDRVAALLQAGDNITLTYDDTAGTLTISATGGGGSGDVVGPSSATDGHMAVFDGTDGKHVRDGGAVPTGAGTPADSVTALDGAAAAGSSTDYSRGDHKHADSARHTQAHGLTSASDHAAATGTDKGKFLHTDPTTGAPALVNINISDLPNTATLRHVTFCFANGGSALSTGMANVTAPVKFAGTLVEVTLESSDGTTGSATVDVLRANGAIPTASNSMVGTGTKPALSSATRSTVTSFSGWTANTFAVNDVLSLNLTAVTALKYLSVTLVIQQTA